MATANMGLATPAVGGTTDASGTQQLVDNLSLLDEHDHSDGKGVKVPVVAGVDWSAGLLLKAVDFAFNTGDGVRTLLVDASVAPRVVTLPSAAANPGRELIIKASTSSGNDVTINRSGGDTIDGATQVIIDNYGVRHLVSDGVSKWLVV